jgi:hypothetical protein
MVGFGYGTSGYTGVSPAAKSLYTRFSFTIDKKDSVTKLNLTLDYDDGFIAYLNGKEIARVNVDKTVQYPPFNAVATRSHASEFMKGLTFPVLGIYLDKTVLNKCLLDGKNIIAVHILNDNAGNDLMFIPLLFDLTKARDFDMSYYDYGNRYKRLIEIDSTDLPLFVVETDQNGIPYDQNIMTAAHLGIVNNGTGRFNKPSDPYNEYNCRLYNYQ